MMSGPAGNPEADRRLSCAAHLPCEVPDVKFGSLVCCLKKAIASGEHLWTQTAKTVT